ncbi:cation:proton antiporter regulatory subunit [Agrococcus carbonis]|uniref:Potassium/proton antiporter regulatory subunit, CPA2 family n=1 Tax=Agrococcus carbonis TaxID=684552 RepID=A0A1H1NRZ1_9MICO|nr:cation:proton antiporter regulatory subunit [Agrococcus carbonis]SDS01728.1 potassium/proton antiporter regulatory subunit, CPA2 family [Agrococcus carbonis]
MQITQTLLPGVGMRYDMTTARGVPLSVVVHREGQADLCVLDRDDPDDVRLQLALNEDEVDALAELLGAARIAEGLLDVTRAIPGLETARLAIEPGSPFAGHPLGSTRARTLTGCSIVAIVRGDDVVAAPGPDERLEAGDVLVVVGSATGIDQLRVRLQPA